jgi:hypothetical protein
MWMVNTNCFGLTGLHVTVDVDWSVAFVAVRIDPLHAGLMRRSWRWIRFKLEARPGHFGCSGRIIFLWDWLLMHWFFEYIDFIPQSNNLVFQILFDLNLFFLIVEINRNETSCNYFKLGSRQEKRDELKCSYVILFQLLNLFFQRLSGDSQDNRTRQDYPEQKSTSGSVMRHGFLLWKKFKSNWIDVYKKIGEPNKN